MHRAARSKALNNYRMKNQQHRVRRGRESSIGDKQKKKHKYGKMYLCI